ncbi:unnamed protein product [Bemisia tabaci]|uniref:Uncharacterized protein n=1 Tax=Bemisia tabaci TaxID=7038 RepID=A0A9N9ZZZ9_BEMTA|nr:unnamed protein product [Bemisia tabaci]
MLADKTKVPAEGGFLGKFYQHLTKKGKAKIKPKSTNAVDLDTPRIEEWDDVEYCPKDSFRQASSLFIFLGQWMCLIPLNHEEFRWLSFRVAFSIGAILCNSAMTLASILWLRDTGANILKGVEHISSLITGLITVKKDSTEIMKHYCVTRFPQVFMHVEFEVWIGFLVLMINMVACHTFAFVDQLVIMFCIGLDEFFDDFNKRIGQERRQKLQPREWRTFRTDYTRLCNLVASVDKCVCHLLFSSFAMHLFTICIELHHSMLLSADREERSHIIFSFIIAGGQACALCFFTVRVHDKSREPLNILYAVPSISYCQEIVGTMLSYEVLLLQLRILTAGKATVGDG